MIFKIKVPIAEFTSADIAAIPIATYWKFPVHRCKIVGEKDLVEISWPLKKIEEEAKEPVK